MDVRRREHLSQALCLEALLQVQKMLKAMPTFGKEDLERTVEELRA